MPIIGTGLNVAGLRSEFFDRFREVTTVYMDLATRYSSNKDVEHHKWLGTVPQMREWGTGRLAKGLRTESYDVANAKYEATIEVDRDEIDDDQTGQIRLRIQELARRAATHKDKMIADLLNNGDQAGYLAYDGKVFFADDHESGASGAQDNLLTFAVADDDVDVFTATEGKTALQNAIEAMMLYLDDQGEPGDRDQGGLVIVCPWAQYYRWLEVINASVINNTTNVMTSAARVIPFSRLTTAGKWFLLKTNEGIRPFIFQDRRPIEFDAVEKGSEQAFHQEKYSYGVSGRYRLAYGEWRYAVQTTFTT